MLAAISGEDDLFIEAFESTADQSALASADTSNLLSVNQLLETVSLHFYSFHYQIGILYSLILDFDYLTSSSLLLFLVSNPFELVKFCIETYHPRQ